MSNINKNINQNKNQNKNQNNEEILKESLMAMIDNNVARVDVPKGLEPDNMMKHIRQLKTEGYFGERELPEGTYEKEYAKKRKIRKVTKVATALAAAAAACIILFVPYGGTKDNPNGSYQAIVDSVKSEDGNGNYMLAGYKELSQYAVASSSIEKKYEVEAQSLFERFMSSFVSEDCDEGMNWDTTISEDLDGESIKNAEMYSDTNVRTEGIDEADVVKTDGKYIYYITDSIGRVELVIAKADGEDTQILSKTGVDYSIFKDYETYAYDDMERFMTRELFVYGDKVVMLMSGIVGYNRYDYYSEEYRTAVLVYDVKNPTEPQLLSELEVDGLYESGRMTDGYIYLFTYESANLNLEDRTYTEEEAMELIAPKVNDKCIEPEQIYVTENDEYDSFKIISTLDINEPSSFKDVMAILGSGRGLNSYVSNEHIYFISNIYHSYVESTDDSGMMENKNQAEILKIDYDAGQIKMDGRTVIDGIIGDEFDIDEYDGYLRIAITKDSVAYLTSKKKYTFFDGETWFDCEMSESDNSVAKEQCSALIILDEKLDLVSELKLHKDESVYGVRFDGDVAYVVTYRQTDPLFAVDLTDPTEPKIMSALEIPGFSTYLHKWDENTLVGIGYVASTSSALKISTYDISDKYDITESNVCKLPTNARSWAPLNHKEIFISPEKNLIGLWFTGEFIIDDTHYSAVYSVYYYDGGELTEVLRCPVTDEDGISDTRGMYIGDCIYIVNDEQGITVYSMNDYTQLACVK